MAAGVVVAAAVADLVATSGVATIPAAAMGTTATATRVAAVATQVAGVRITTMTIDTAQAWDSTRLWLESFSLAA